MSTATVLPAATRPPLSFADILEDMAASLDQPQPELLVLLVQRLRPQSVQDTGDIHWRMQQLCAALADDAQAAVLADFILGLLRQYHQVSLYADTGIADPGDFFVP